MAKNKNHKINCQDCQKTFIIKATEEEMEKYKTGTPVGLAIPDLDTEKQTMLLGSRCKKCTNIALAA